MTPDVPLSLRQAQYFVAVADEGSFTRAAAALRISQPSLSHQVRALEAAIGAPLLERGPRTVTLTPAGRALLPAARSALEVLARGREAARSAAGLQSGEIVIATTQSLAQGVLPRTLRAWRRQHPGVDVAIREHTHLRALRDDLLVGRADVALAQRPDDWNGPIGYVGDEELVVVVGEDDELAGRDSLRLRALAERRWVLPDPSNGLSDAVELACAQAGFVPQAAVRSLSVSTLVELAAAGMGPTLVPANVLPSPLTGRALRCEPPITRSIAVFALEAGAPLVEGLVACAREHGDVAR